MKLFEYMINIPVDDMHFQICIMMLSARSMSDSLPAMFKFRVNFKLREKLFD